MKDQRKLSFIVRYPPYLFVCEMFLKIETSSCCHLSRFMIKPTKWLCAQRRLRSAWASAQTWHWSDLADALADLSLRWAHNPICWFCGRLMIKPTKWLCAQWRLRSAWASSLIRVFAVRSMGRFLHTDSEDTDQTWRMPSLILVFAGRTIQFVGFAAAHFSKLL